ncbi:helix-turn-helix domain-containing protein [Microbacterium sp. NPDC055357]
METVDISVDLTVEQAAQAKQVSTKTIRRAIARGELEARRYGPRLIRISASSLALWGKPLAVVA